MADAKLGFAADDNSNIIYREKRKLIGVNLPMGVNQRIVCANVPFELFDGAYISFKATGVNAANATINIYRTVFPEQPVLADDIAQFIPIPGATGIFPINAGPGFLDFQIQNFYGDRIMIELVSGGANAGILNDIYIVGKKRG